MRVSELVKKLFSVMTKDGDLDIVGLGEVRVEGDKLILDGMVVTADDSEIISALLSAERGDKTSIILT